MASLVINYSIPFGASIRIGYRQLNTSGPFTYISGFPTYNDSPYTISGIPTGSYEVETTTICPNCGGGVFSDPIITPAEAEP